MGNLKIQEDLSKPCYAVITTQITVFQPMEENGPSVLLSSFQDNYNIELETRGQEETKKEIQLKMEIIKNNLKNKKEDNEKTI
jgi:hypothetical protein